MILLRVNQKILRLRRVVGSIINIDQTCAVLGRSILNNCHLMRNIIDYIKQKDLNLYLSASLYRRLLIVSHQYLFSVLRSFVFWKRFYSMHSTSLFVCVCDPVIGTTNLNKSALVLHRFSAFGLRSKRG